MLIELIRLYNLTAVINLYIISITDYYNTGLEINFVWGSKLCYQVQDKVAKLILGSKSVRRPTFLRNEKILILSSVFPQQSCRGRLRLRS